ncbi:MULTISPECIES: HAD-IIIC family phosphatase [unclassified Methylobacterium]|uniref:HAD-IIIC family phosphatase n=1 Tax=unclassified Methylobacterium TaxID=2615210 RepID=UPI002269B9E6|nr:MULTISPECIES: HAD-IIIC family phosphatase [unclassified Methylobacterium]
MSLNMYESLNWLPLPIENFRHACKALLDEQADLAASLSKLAGARLDNNQLRILGGTVKALLDKEARLTPLSPFRLALLGTGTTDLVIPALMASAIRHGIALNAASGSYDQALQDALDPASTVNAMKPDGVLIALDHRSLPISITPGNSDKAAETVENCLQLYRTICTAIKSHSNALCILQTIPRRPEQLLGSLDRSVAGTLGWILDRLNAALIELSRDDGNILFDVEHLAATVGTSNWFSDQEWNVAKLPFSYSFIPLYADRVGSIIGAIRGKSRKCLVLDLDNTVWGGVIGDDGMAGINIRQGDATGEAHLVLQQTAVDLHKRGILLAVSSKNTDEVAREPFRNHPEMLLREKHLVAFQANWNDKASNIAAIAQELNIGLDSLVFVDDNPVERDQIRRALPSVLVPELTEDPAGYARTLIASNCFEAISFNEDDKKRSDSYKDNAKRLDLMSKSINMDEYLQTLQMEILFSPFDKIGRSRVAQLINKSNQYNLTTRRYTEAEVQKAEEDPQVYTLQVRLQDKFGDNGMISVVICRPAGETVWVIDTWLMSCRVLGRKVEHMVLREMLIQAKASGVTKLVGEWIPSGRNDMVKDHYPKLGFTLKETLRDGATTWELSTDVDLEEPTMKITRIDRT